MNEKNVPKRYKNIFTLPLINKSQELVDIICSANNCYPKDADEYKRRKNLQQDALDIVEHILQRLQFMLEVLEHINPNKMQKIVELCVDETKLIKGWRTSDKSRFADLP